MMLLFGALTLAGCGPEVPPDVEPFTSDPLSAKQGYMLGLGVPEAWARERGAVTVAVIDNGVDVDHPDLKARLWTNPGEAPDGEDNDGDGRVDDIHGWNFLDNSSDVGAGSEGGRLREHGTAVAGIIAAETENGEGVAGLCPGCSIMVLKARDFERENSVLPLLGEAVDYAIAHGAKVINISDGALTRSISPERVGAIEAAALRAEEAGVIVVASAGNDAIDDVRWPARAPLVLAVAAVDWDGAPASFTTFGAEVDVAAPGVFIHTTMPGGEYGFFDGTSASAPITAGLAALIASAEPGSSPAAITARVKEAATSVKIEDRPDVKGRFGAGVVSFSAVP